MSTFFYWTRDLSNFARHVPKDIYDRCDVSTLLRGGKLGIKVGIDKLLFSLRFINLSNVK